RMCSRPVSGPLSRGQAEICSVYLQNSCSRAACWPWRGGNAESDRGISFAPAPADSSQAAISGIDPVIMSHAPADANPIDIFEHGAPREGKPQSMNRRLFMQLLVFNYDGDLPMDQVLRTLST